MRIALSGIATALGLFAMAGTAFAADDYYKGKRLTVMVNFAAGGPTDIEGRIFAKYLSKYVEGNSGVIVQNMDGAGGIVGVNYIGEIAPKDGTVIGFVTGAAFTYAIDPTPRRVDFSAFEFVAIQPGTSVYFVRSDVKPGMKTATDIGKAEGLISGGLGADSPKDILLRLTLDMLGRKYNYVTGYKGSNGARMALQQGEINFYAESPPSYRGVIEPGMVAKGEVVPVFYDPEYDGRTFSTSSQMKGLDILPFQELYRKIHGKLPEGGLWEAYKTVLTLHGAMQRQIILPPKAPQAAIDALRAAILKVNADPAHAEDSMKTFGFVPHWIASADVNDRVRNNLTLKPEMKQFIIAYVKRELK